MKKMPINTYKQTYQNHQDSWWGMQLSPQRSGQECTSLEKSCFKSSSGVCHCYLPCKSPYVQWNSNPNHPTDPSNFWCTNCLSPNSFENPVKQQLSEGIGSIIPNQQRTCHWFFFRPQGICLKFRSTKNRPEVGEEVLQRWCLGKNTKVGWEGIQEIFVGTFFWGGAPSSRQCLQQNHSVFGDMNRYE